MKMIYIFLFVYLFKRFFSTLTLNVLSSCENIQAYINLKMLLITYPTNNIFMNKSNNTATNINNKNKISY